MCVCACVVLGCDKSIAYVRIFAVCSRMRYQFPNTSSLQPNIQPAIIPRYGKYHGRCRSSVHTVFLCVCRVISIDPVQCVLFTAAFGPNSHQLTRSLFKHVVLNRDQKFLTIWLFLYVWPYVRINYPHVPHFVIATRNHLVYLCVCVCAPVCVCNIEITKWYYI